MKVYGVIVKSTEELRIRVSPISPEFDPVDIFATTLTLAEAAELRDQLSIVLERAVAAQHG